MLTAFCSSKKRHLILTGEKGSGKSTLLRALISALKQTDETALAHCACPGFTTRALWTQGAPRPDRIILTDNLTGESATIGLPSMPPAQNASGGRAVGRASLSGCMQAVPEGFLGLGLRSLSRAAKSPCPTALLDEIGYLEEGCTPFYDAVSALFACKSVFAAVRREVLPKLLSRLSPEEIFVFDLSAKQPKIGAVVMASGNGSRFRAAMANGQSCPNKLMADFCNEPLITPVLRAAAHPMITDRIAVTRTAEIRALCETLGFPCQLHRQPLLSDTIRLGLLSLAQGLDGCIFFQADQPLITWESIEALILAFAQDQRLIYRLSWNDSPGSPVLFPSVFFSELLTLAPDCGGSAVIRRHPEAVRLVSAQNANELLDADTPEALASMSALPPKAPS